jgi:type IV/VI secretion system ImpK/VasF family protein
MDEYEIKYWTLLVGLGDLLSLMRTDEVLLEDIGSLREKVIRKLKEIHDTVIKVLSDKDAYYLIFSLTALSDEIAQSHVQKFETAGWEPLQFQLYGMADAGNVFFGYLDSFKGRNDISGLVRKTYLYCLNDGFKGKYVLEAGRIETYREDLRAYVDMKEVRVDGEGHDKKTASSYPVGIWVYYVILLLAIILVHQVLLTIPLSLSLP